MVAFVDDEMPIITDDIIDFAPANQALDQGDVDLTFRFAAAAADYADRVTLHI